MDDLIDANASKNKIGLTRKEIKSLKSFEYIDQSQASDICSVCYSDYTFGDELVILKCNHMFHKLCISKWLDQNGRCPICKSTQVERH